LEPVLDAKKGTITTGHAALERIYVKTGVEAVKALRKLNKLDELLSTFLKVEKDKPQIKVAHAHFNVHGTSTGRLSSSDPNLQNIPGSIRHIYVPHHEDWVIWEMDFSGIENRLQSYFAGDKKRTERLGIPGFSEHKYLAGKISGVDYKLIEKSSDPDSIYSKAKHVVHGVDRGLGPKKASKMYGIPLKECHELFDAWKAEIKPTILWQQQLAAEASKNGVLINPFGRKQFFWTSDTYTKSLSFPPQATGADVLYRVMIALLYERIGWPEEKVKQIVPLYQPLPKPSNVLICVHDSLVGESPRNQVEEVLNLVTKIATQPWPELNGMTLPIEIKYGPSWGECESV
jgi:DNA polymerase-1